MNRSFDELEIEGKRLLDVQEFMNIKTYFQLNEDDFIIQHNHYFDTSDFQLKEQNAALRIRYKNGAHILTLKVRSEAGVMEKHQPLGPREWSEGDPLTQLNKGGSVQAYLEKEWQIPFHTLRSLGRLTTWRAELPYEQGLLVLDESRYFGEVDYELEFEGDSQEHVQRVLTQIAVRAGLDSHSPEPQPKIQRFFSVAKGRI
ncbi:CYTH domain-containing protein [Salicibibacter cibarius]|uniref:CYTH domain-containing protein n=1 Tax=Salicibibacter cibarius TaxID=2743000 RepID=A0A7T6Z516_9BACI|nr:CYTH domain-containing protein [Salicibibacter cibarius]QQK76928.1 CYTH domain-containing protein [Salicibibacter cibarius]